MPANFDVACRAARDAISVPPIPLEAIRSAAQAGSQTYTSGRRRAVLIAVVASVSLVAAAAAAEFYGRVQVMLGPSGAVNVSFDPGSAYRAVIRNPKPADFEKAARAMDFPVVFPTGLPQGTRAEVLMVFGPSAMQIVYDLPGAWRRSNHLLVVMLANPAAVATGTAHPPRAKYQLQFVPAEGRGAARWTVGRENVILLNSQITPAELAHFKASMHARVR